jgi:hypothetical protein
MEPEHGVIKVKVIICVTGQQLKNRDSRGIELHEGSASLLSSRN